MSHCANLDPIKDCVACPCYACQSPFVALFPMPSLLANVDNFTLSVCTTEDWERPIADIVERFLVFVIIVVRHGTDQERTRSSPPKQTGLVALVEGLRAR